MHKINTEPLVLSNSDSHCNIQYPTDISSTNNSLLNNGMVIETSQSSNNSRHPVIQQIIVQPTELLPVLPAPHIKKEPLKENSNSTSKIIFNLIVLYSGIIKEKY